MSENKQTILAIDDTSSNLDLLKELLLPEYRLLLAKTGKLGLQIALKQKPDLILLDIMMPEMSGHEVCQHLKSNPLTEHIPIIFLTAMNEAADEEYGLSLGAVDYITKPIRPPILRARVNTHLCLANQKKAIEKEVVRKTAQLEESQRSAVFMLGEAGHYNDNDTGVHIWRMAAYSAALARQALWPVEKVKTLELAAPMHDTGKIGIPDKILKAPRKLTTDEFEVIKTHSLIGHQILSKSDTPLFNMAAEIALGHHEKWDGSGYPDGLKSENIPQSARIVAIADVFDALTMKRPYKMPWSVEEAFTFLQEGAGSHFDPQLVELFLNIKDELLEIMCRWQEQ